MIISPIADMFIITAHSLVGAGLQAKYLYYTDVGLLFSPYTAHLFTNTRCSLNRSFILERADAPPLGSRSDNLKPVMVVTVTSIPFSSISLSMVCIKSLIISSDTDRSLASPASMYASQKSSFGKYNTYPSGGYLTPNPVLSFFSSDYP